MQGGRGYDLLRRRRKRVLVGVFRGRADYDAIKAELLKVDDRLEKCIEFGKGIRILKQDIWETIISFIISANNNIPRIKKIIETLCRLYGDEIEPPPELGLDPDAKFYSFPPAERLMELEPEDLGELRSRVQG